jgi:hypothetical protein
MESGQGDFTDVEAHIGSPNLLPAKPVVPDQILRSLSVAIVWSPISRSAYDRDPEKSCRYEKFFFRFGRPQGIESV